MKKSKIWLSSPHLGGAEQEFVNEAFKTNWIAPLGPNVDGFENDLSAYLKVGGNTDFHTAVLSSGTAAIHLALVMLDVNPDDVVIVQSFTFCGTTNPVIYQGANIVFIDSEKDTWNMCPDALEQSLKKLTNEGYGTSFRGRDGKGRIRAIIPVHLYGMPAKMDEIGFVAEKYGVPVVEDAAEALGSTYGGRRCGTFGIMAALSFNGNKIITTSGGGALVSSDPEYVRQAKFLSTQARDKAPHYEHSTIGYNYRMSNVTAGIGRGQMKVLDRWVEKRRANNFKYRTYFKDMPGVYFQSEPNERYFSNYWLTAIVLDPAANGGVDREKVRMALEQDQIESRPLWKPMHMQPVFRGASFFGSGQCEYLFNNGLCLPSGSNLTDAEFERIFESLSRIFSH